LLIFIINSKNDPSQATVTSPTSQNGERQTIEFDYRDEPSQICTKPIPISPKQALDELDVEKSLPPASPPKDEEEIIQSENSPSTEENSLTLEENEDDEDFNHDVQSQIE